MKIRIHFGEMLRFSARPLCMEVHGVIARRIQSFPDVRIYDSQWRGKSGYSAYCRFFFLTILLFCKKDALLTARCSGFSGSSQSGGVDGARSRRGPRGAPPPTTRLGFGSCLLTSFQSCCKLLLTAAAKQVVRRCRLSSHNHAGLLYPLKSYSASLVYP